MCSILHCIYKLSSPEFVFQNISKKSKNDTSKNSFETPSSDFKRTNINGNIGFQALH